MIHPTRLGIGTYLGDLSDTCTEKVQNVILTAIKNHHITSVDTAINYRAQRSERAIGALFSKDPTLRNHMFLSTKGGFIPFNLTIPSSIDDYLQKEILPFCDIPLTAIHDKCHSLHPKYIAWSFEQSLRNLRTRFVDVFFLHNPEFALGFLERSEWETKIMDCFAYLEEQVGEGKCMSYGLATWQGLRVPSSNAHHIDLECIWQRAHTQGLTHFTAIQLPVNAYMRQFLTLPNQHLSDNHSVTVQTWAKTRNVQVWTSAPLLQGELISHIRDVLDVQYNPQTHTPAENLLHWILAQPHITTTLLGTTSLQHLEDAAKLCNT